MKVLGVVGSNRKNGNSYLLLEGMLRNFSSIETKIIQIAELEIKPCEVCFERCAANPFECVINDDFQKLFTELKTADGIIFACPFYFYVPSKFQAFLERISGLDYFTLERHGEGNNPLVGKPCLLVTVSASGSSFNAFQILHHLQEFALMLQMKTVNLRFWPFIGLSAKTGGIESGAVLKETETLKQAREAVSLLIKKIEGGSARL
ncbi:MAG: flavodoxin family protein [Candidatus Bathyarchaeia archaeon]|nr:flavodoxin family protein [Candidatus Bathyarchaeota archaeon A05DMB-3]